MTRTRVRLPTDVQTIFNNMWRVGHHRDSLRVLSWTQWTGEGTVREVRAQEDREGQWEKGRQKRKRDTGKFGMKVMKMTNKMMN